MVRIKIHRRRLFLIIILLIAILILYLEFVYHNENAIPDKIILSPSHLACQQPKFYEDSTSEYFLKSHDPLQCSKEKDWVIVNGSVGIIAQYAINKHGNIECQFTELIRIDDDTTVLGPTSSSRVEFLLTTDFYKVYCTADDKESWEGVIAGIRADNNIKEEYSWQHVAPEALQFNVLLLGFASLSRVAFKRALPNTYKFLTDGLSSYVLEGYNIVGDGTPQALIPFLTGKMELELPEARKRMAHQAQHVDIYPFIWKRFEKNGFVTLFSEDQPEIGTFNYRLKGFNKTPTHHYMRPFYNYIQPTLGRHQKYCLGSHARHQVFLNYLQNFFSVYKDMPKFAFGMHGELSQEDPELITVADNDIRNFLSNLDKSGHFQRTILVVFSDHGHRQLDPLDTQQGKQEIRLPFISIYLPKEVKELYPSSADNVRVNRERLTTPFDLHETLKDLTNFQGAKLGRVNNRGISLFSEIPTSRTCGDAFIEAQWCACLSWEPLSTKDERVSEAADALIIFLNTFTAHMRSFCYEMQLKDIVWSALLVPNEGLLHYRGASDVDGFVADLSGGTPLSMEVYQVAVSTKPREQSMVVNYESALFEASLTYNIKRDSFSVRIDDISRLNPLPDGFSCIRQRFPGLSKYCFCRKSLHGKD